MITIRNGTQKRDARRFRRPLCILCWVWIGFVFSALIFINRREIFKESDSTYDPPIKGEKTVTGEIYFREKRSNSTVLYLKNVHLLSGSDFFEPDVLLVYAEKESVYSIGSIVEIKGKISKTEHAGNPGQFDERIYYRTKGILWKQYAETVRFLSRRDTLHTWYEERVTGFGEECCRRLETIFTPETAGLLKAMLFGTKSDETKEWTEGFDRLGISHLLSISGLHFSMLMGTFYLLMKKIFLPRPVSILLTVWAIASYMQLLGFRVSAFRAGGMFFLLLFAEAVGRTYDRLTALGILGALISLSNPWALLTAAFWLSFLATAGTALAAEFRDERERREQELGMAQMLLKADAEARVQEGRAARKEGQRKILRERMFNILLFPAVVQMTVLPVTVWFFFEIPVYGLLWNLLLVPLAGIFLGSGILSLFFSGFFYTGGIFLGGAAETVAVLYRFACRVGEGLPGSLYICGRPGIWQIGFYYVIFALLLWVWWPVKGRKRHHWKGLLTGFYVLAFADLIFLRQSPEFQVTFLDVGQGDCAVICEKNGMTVLIDCGSTDEKNVGTYRLLPFLKYCGIRRVDYVFASHGDEDHISGIQELLEQDEIAVGAVICFKLCSEKLETVQGLAGKSHIPVLGTAAGESLAGRNMKITCLAPDGKKVTDKRSENDQSLVLLLEYKGARFLFTGDMETEEESELLSEQKPYLLRTLVLKVGHHGSETSTSDAFLTETTPQVAVISCGAENRYGHPAAETLARLSENGAEIYRTDRDGAVIMRMHGRTLRIQKYKG